MRDALAIRPGAVWCVLIFGVVTLEIGWSPRSAHAGGPEFPAGGTRSLGRGAAAFARADDPSAMARNPAVLADLWDDQALLGAHLALVEACFLPTGAYGSDVLGEDVSDFGEGPRYSQASDGDTDLAHDPLVQYAAEPFTEVCYDGPAPFLPQLALSVKLSDALGAGLGFFPPDGAFLSQLGNRDGTLETPSGRRPNPTRFQRSAQNASFFSVLAAVGYRLNDVISVGAGVQWSLVVFELTTWSGGVSRRNPSNDVRVDVFGRDLFIPGLIASVQLRPADALEVALGVKWSDRIRAKAKLDLTAGAFGTGEPFEYIDAESGAQRIAAVVPVTTPNQVGTVEAPPIWVPQLAVGVRYADRLKPAVRDWRRGHRASGRHVEDALSNERWDVELDAVYYFASAYDRTRFLTQTAGVTLRSVAANGATNDSPIAVGTCLEPNDEATVDEDSCPKKTRATTTALGGRNQLSLRAGGDYNLLPGRLALRAGASYETDGQDVERLQVLTYMLSRTGLHAGVTVRLAEATDVSIGYAHFFQRTVHLQVNPLSRYPRRYKSRAYGFEPGLGEPDAAGEHGDRRGDFDGIARAEQPDGDAAVGPYFINAGVHRSGLDVLSLSFTQHY